MTQTDNPVEPIVPQEQPTVPVQPEQPTIPQDTRDKTREQFEKLLESNKKLYEANNILKREMEQRQTAADTFNPIQNPQKPQVDTNDFVEKDPITGESYINEAKLKSHISNLEQKASRAEQAINSYIKTNEDREIERQNLETFRAHPDLNPTDSEHFDPILHKQVRGLILDSMYNSGEYGGRPLSFKAAADLVKTQRGMVTAPKAEPIAPKVDTKVNEKQNASVDLQSAPPAPKTMTDDEFKALSYKTRTGSDEALARRLLNTDHVVSK